MREAQFDVYLPKLDPDTLLGSFLKSGMVKFDTEAEAVDAVKRYARYFKGTVQRVHVSGFHRYSTGGFFVALKVYWMYSYVQPRASNNVALAVSQPCASFGYLYDCDGCGYYDDDLL